MSSASELPDGAPAPGEVYETRDGEKRHVSLISHTPGGPRVRWRSGEPETGLRYGQASMAEWLAWVEQSGAQVVRPRPPRPARRPQRRRVPLTVDLEQYRELVTRAEAEGLKPVDWVHALVVRELDNQAS